MLCSKLDCWQYIANWKAYTPFLLATTSGLLALGGALSCRFISVDSDYSGASTHIGIDRWEQIVQVGNNQFDGVCREYKTPPEDQFWIIAQYTSPATVILGVLVSLILWKASLCPMTKIGWRVLLLFVLLCPFLEMTTIVFFLYGNGCLNTNDALRPRCYPSQGEIAAGVAIFIWLLVCFIMWRYPPQSNEKDKVDEFEGEMGEIGIFSKGGLIELQDLSVKSGKESKESSEETEFTLSAIASTADALPAPKFPRQRSSFKSMGSNERFFEKAEKDALMNLGDSDFDDSENSSTSPSLKSVEEEDLTSVALNVSARGKKLPEMI